MLSNGNNSMAFNDFSEMPYIPYKIITALLNEESQIAENFWKLLKYADVDALDKDNLTYDEKVALIWRGDSIEQNFTSESNKESTREYVYQQLLDINKTLQSDNVENIEDIEHKVKRIEKWYNNIGPTYPEIESLLKEIKKQLKD